MSSISAPISPCTRMFRLPEGLPSPWVWLGPSHSTVYQLTLSPVRTRSCSGLPAFGDLASDLVFSKKKKKKVGMWIRSFRERGPFSAFSVLSERFTCVDV